MKSKGKFYRVHIGEYGAVVYPECNIIIQPEDEDKYRLINMGGTCCEDISLRTIKCLKYGSLLEIF